MAGRTPSDDKPKGPQSARGAAQGSVPSDTTVSGGFPATGADGKPWLQGGSTVVGGKGTQDNDSYGVAPWRPDSGAWFPRPTNSWFTDTTTPVGVANASDFNSPQYNATFSMSQLAGVLNAPETQGGLFEIVAAGRGHNATANGVLQAYVAESNRLSQQGQRVTPQQLAYQEAVDNGWIKDGKVTVKAKGSGGGGGGPSTSIAYEQIGKADLRDLASQIGMEMVGRGVSDDEFARILKRVRAVEKNNPQVTHSNGAGVSTTQQGVSNSDRQDVIQNILAKNPAYGDYQKATTMMDWFGNALNARLQNA